MSAKSASQKEAARMTKRDRVVLEHLPLVKAIAVRVHENLPVHVDLDDVVHAGILALFYEASKYNPFRPDLQQQLSLAYAKAGDRANSNRHRAVAARLIEILRSPRLPAAQ